MPAFEVASRLGVPYIEFDVHMTSDGVIIVAHDEDLARVAGQNGIVSAMTLAEVQTYDIGYQFTRGGQAFPFRGAGIRVPTLREVLESFPQQLFVIEIKQRAPSLVSHLLEAIRDARMTKRVLIASEHQAPLDEVRRLAPAIPTSFSADEVAAFIVPSGHSSFQPLGAALQIPPEYDSLKLVTPENVAAAHRLGLEIHVWTINEPTQMRELLALGVDGIMSDYPAMLRQVADAL